jgi:hypothetical protein
MPIIQPNTTESDLRTQYDAYDRWHGHQDYMINHTLKAIIVITVATVIAWILIGAGAIDLDPKSVTLYWLAGAGVISIAKMIAEIFYKNRIKRSDSYQARMIAPSG